MHTQVTLPKGSVTLPSAQRIRNARPKLYMYTSVNALYLLVYAKREEGVHRQRGATRP